MFHSSFISRALLLLFYGVFFLLLLLLLLSFASQQKPIQVCAEKTLYRFLIKVKIKWRKQENLYYGIERDDKLREEQKQIK